MFAGARNNRLQQRERGATVCELLLKVDNEVEEEVEKEEQQCLHTDIQLIVEGKNIEAVHFSINCVSMSCHAPTQESSLPIHG
jgi:hypothetical protein